MASSLHDPLLRRVQNEIRESVGGAKEIVLLQNSRTPDEAGGAAGMTRAKAVSRRIVHRPLRRGVVILSFDTEQIWGHLDMLNEAKFHDRYPNALEAHDCLLKRLCSAAVSATWFVVGGMALMGSQGERDRRLTGLPDHWTVHVPAGSEATTPLWYRRSFIERLRDSAPQQEIGLHGGLTHLIWTNPRASRQAARQELAEGINALEQVGVSPRSFSFPRDQEAYHDLLVPHGIRCYRGRLRVLSHRLGRTFGGRVLRALDELRRAVPPLVWPEETFPGLWNVPSSLFLYPIGPSRTRLVALRTRVERFARGLREAIHERGIFHFCLHPENLAESPLGLAMLDDILERLVRARDSGDVEILTMAGIAERMEQLRENDDVACSGAAAGARFESARAVPGSSD